MKNRIEPVLHESTLYETVIPRSTATRNLLPAYIRSLLPVLSTAMLVIFLCCGLQGQNTSYEPDPNWHASANAARKTNPLKNSPQLAGGGKKLFLRDCAECHSEDGSGMVEKHSADLQSPIVQSLSDGALLWKITNGNPGRGMPSFSRLPEKQRWQLVLFLRTLRSAPRNSAEK